MKKRKRRKPQMVKISGLILGLAGSAIIIHTVPIYIWYAVLALATAMLAIYYILP
ncbi:hypothetical protein MASR2M70_01180 [Bacillota bacterium]